MNKFLSLFSILTYNLFMSNIKILSSKENDNNVEFEIEVNADE
jgi:hypothetical protein